MRVSKSRAALAIVAWWVAAPIWALEPSTPLSVYGRLPFLEDVSISPDGTRLAFVRTTGDTRALFLVEVDGGKVLGGLRIGATKLRGVFWQDNDTVISIGSSTSSPSGPVTEAMRHWLGSLCNPASTAAPSRWRAHLTYR